jgi:CRISPR-associated protein Cmr3
MSDNHSWLVRLRPLGPFFFGLGSGPGRADYYLQSARFPQQTGLLGLIRHQLLLQHGLLAHHAATISNPEAAQQLIGPRSFDATEPQAQCFGIVRRIGPCGLYHRPTDEFFLPAAPVFTRQYALLAAQSGQRVYTGKGEKPLCQLATYDPKAHYAELLLQGNKGTTIGLGDCLTEHERPGITKNYNGISEQDAYYKQAWLHFTSSDWEYAFRLDCEPDTAPLADNLVNFGKERSLFKMVLQPWNAVYHSPVAAEPAQRLLLLSDAFVPGDDFLSACSFAVNSSTPFRHIINRITQPQRAYYNMRPHEVNSNNLLLLRRGSVFFFDQADGLNKAVARLEAQACFVQIGCNQYVKL